MSEAEEVADRLHSVAIHLLRRLRHEDAGAPVTAAQLSALSVLVFGGPRTLGSLAAAEQVRSPTMSRIVGDLTRAGLVERRSVEGDGRRTLVAATEAGRRVMVAGRRRRVASLTKRLQSLPESDLATLGRAADLLGRAIESNEDPNVSSPR